MKEWTTRNCFVSILLLIGHWTQISHSENEASAGEGMAIQDIQPNRRAENVKNWKEGEIIQNGLPHLRKSIKRSTPGETKLREYLIQKLNLLYPYYSSKAYNQMFIPANKYNNLRLPKLAKYEPFQAAFVKPPPRDNKRQQFNTWGGKRDSSNRPFKAWGGKRDPDSKPFTAWGGKREDNSKSFKSWGGKRSSKMDNSYVFNENSVLLPSEIFKRSIYQSSGRSLKKQSELNENFIKKRFIDSFEWSRTKPIIDSAIGKHKIIRKTSQGTFNPWAGKKRSKVILY